MPFQSVIDSTPKMIQIWFQQLYDNDTNMIYFYDRSVFITNAMTLILQRFYVISIWVTLKKRERKIHLKEIDKRKYTETNLNGSKFLCETKIFKFIADVYICISIEIQGLRNTYSTHLLEISFITFKNQDFLLI